MCAIPGSGTGTLSGSGRLKWDVDLTAQVLPALGGAAARSEPHFAVCAPAARPQSPSYAACREQPLCKHSNIHWML